MDCDSGNKSGAAARMREEPLRRASRRRDRLKLAIAKHGWGTDRDAVPGGSDGVERHAPAERCQRRDPPVLPKTQTEGQRLARSGDDPPAGGLDRVCCLSSAGALDEDGRLPSGEQTDRDLESLPSPVSRHDQC